MNDMSKTLDFRNPDVEIYDALPVPPARTTTNLALAATHTEPSAPYVGIERQVAYAMGVSLQQLMLSGMADHHETARAKNSCSVLSSQLLDAYQQLRFGKDALQKAFRDFFVKTFSRHPENIEDIRGGKFRLQDADLVTGVVRKFCPWQDIADDFEAIVYADRLLVRKFLQFFFWVYRERVEGRARVPAEGCGVIDRTNTALVTFEQSGIVVRLTFSQRIPIRLEPKFELRRYDITFVGSIDDTCGASYRIESSTFSLGEATLALESFNYKGDSLAFIFDKRLKNVGQDGFVIVAHPKTRRPVLMDTRELNLF